MPIGFIWNVTQWVSSCMVCTVHKLHERLPARLYCLLRLSSKLFEGFLWHRNLADSQRSYHHCRDWIWCSWAGMGYCSDGMGVRSTGAAHVSAFSFLACKIAIDPHLALASSVIISKGEQLPVPSAWSHSCKECGDFLCRPAFSV